MPIINQKTALIITVATLVNLLVFGVIAYAQNTDNQGVSLNVNPYYSFSTPDTLTLPQAFINMEGDTYVYQAFLPDNEDERIYVTDFRNNGGFLVTLSIENFTHNGDTIPYTDVGIVTLSKTDTPDTVDTPLPPALQNQPPGSDSGTVFAPLDCNWNFTDDFKTACDHSFEDFTGVGAQSDPQTIIDGRIPSGPGRLGQYWVSLGLRLKIPNGTPAGNYSSTFVFTLEPAP